MRYQKFRMPPIAQICAETADKKLTELTSFTHMKHVLITDTKTGVSGVTSNAQLFDDHIFIAMLATKEKGKCRKTYSDLQTSSAHR